MFSMLYKMHSNGLDFRVLFCSSQEFNLSGLNNSNASIEHDDSDETGDIEELMMFG